VLVDEVEEGRVVARSYADAPEINGRVIVPGAWELDPGDFIEVEISRAGAHDLLGQPVDIEEYRCVKVFAIIAGMVRQGAATST
jgi:tRNA A37 methylthiotransferase MiaB